MKPILFFLLISLVSPVVFAGTIIFNCSIKALSNTSANFSGNLEVTGDSLAKFTHGDFHFSVGPIQVSHSPNEVEDALVLFINGVTSYFPLNVPWAYLRVPFANGEEASIYCKPPSD